MWFYILLVCILIKLYNKYHCGWCYDRTYMTGKIVVVTGANCGLGYETALNLAKRGAKVILACRDHKKGTTAAEDIQARTGNKNVLYKNLDLMSLKSIRRFVEDFKSSEVKLDVLINNAATTGHAHEKTEDGIVKEMQTNHFGPFLLTILLIPLLKNAENGRVITVSSMAHLLGKIDLDNINEVSNKTGRRHMFQIYCNTKLCNVYFSNELARRLKHTSVTVNSLHPGHIYTSIYRNSDWLSAGVMNIILSTFFKTPVEGIQTIVYLAVSADVSETSGKYFMDCKEADIYKSAKNEKIQQELWDLSVKMVGLKPEELKF